MNAFFKFVVISALLSISLMLFGCGSDQVKYPPPPKPVEDPAQISWNFEADGIRYAFEADANLNYQKDRPLAVTVCIFQLKDISTFNAKVRTLNGLHELLSGKTPEGTLGFRSLSIQPGAFKEMRAERMEGARYIGVVAGYAHNKIEYCAASLPLAVHIEKKGVFRTPYYSAGKTDVIIHLGTESVTVTGVERVQ